MIPLHLRHLFLIAMATEVCCPAFGQKPHHHHHHHHTKPWMRFHATAAVLTMLPQCRLLLRHKSLASKENILSCTCEQLASRIDDPYIVIQQDVSCPTTASKAVLAVATNVTAATILDLTIIIAVAGSTAFLVLCVQLDPKQRASLHQKRLNPTLDPTPQRA